MTTWETKGETIRETLRYKNICYLYDLTSSSRDRKCKQLWLQRLHIKVQVVIFSKILYRFCCSFMCSDIHFWSALQLVIRCELRLRIEDSILTYKGLLLYKLSLGWRVVSLAHSYHIFINPRLSHRYCFMII